MDKQEYLNQISESNRPVKNRNGILGKLFSSKFFWLGFIAVVGFILIAILGSILKGSNGSVKADSYALQIRISNTMEIIDSYQKLVKSSVLRSDSASLNSVLSNTNIDLDNYLNEKYSLKRDEITKMLGSKVVDGLDQEKQGLEEELFNAKINGNLDRIYAHKMAYEISVIMNDESKIYNSNSDDALKNIMVTSYNSLENLYNKISNFSEAK